MLYHLITSSAASQSGKSITESLKKLEEVTLTFSAQPGKLDSVPRNQNKPRRSQGHWMTGLKETHEEMLLFQSVSDFIGLLGDL